MIPRQEHPKPQFRRDNWLNLNGVWEFEKDSGNSGSERGFEDKNHVFPLKINVPFCPQSTLSGIADTDFMSSVWYRRTFVLSEADLDGRIVLHFGACDYFTTVFVNGKAAGTHKGGYVSFSFDITGFVTPGENILTVHAEDNERDPLIPSGKQSRIYYSHGCDYTRTTGIWQTVWIEFTPRTYISGLKFFPSLENDTLTVIADLQGAGLLRVDSSFEGADTGSAET
ncbi:MAG: hypothetical protein J5830_02705 [Clostridia bacterium]|nr:hypothetical protein [Clostridia bacterium]